ncbi:MAG: nucleoside phosphorylase [Promethearchaeota archaeon]
MDFFDNDSRVYINPSETIKFYRAAYPLPLKLIYSPFSRPELPQKSKKRKIKELPALYQGTHLYCIDNKVLYFQGLMGASTTAIFLEQLIALGIKEFIFLGLAGAIQKAKIGDRIIVTEAIRLEGTSYHYLPVNIPSVPSENLFNDLVEFLNSKGVPFAKGTICSTDAPFRETFNLVEQLRLKEVIAIEMETAAAFAIANFRNVKAAALVIISDELKENQWSGFQPDHFSESFISSFNHLVDFFSR